jgi:nucleotide-binding universal stress UspA family protein
MMKVVVSASEGEETRAARDWCAANLHEDDEVIAVVGTNQVGEFVLGAPPLDSINGAQFDLIEAAQREVCVPLTSVGVACTSRLVRRTQGRALVQVAREEHADLIVVGKYPHGSFADAVLGEVATQLAHRPPCPLVIVPVGAASVLHSSG